MSEENEVKKDWCFYEYGNNSSFTHGFETEAAAIAAAYNAYGKKVHGMDLYVGTTTDPRTLLDLDLDYVAESMAESIDVEDVGIWITDREAAQKELDAWVEKYVVLDMKLVCIDGRRIETKDWAELEASRG
jgi:hypothetical protein